MAKERTSRDQIVENIIRATEHLQSEPNANVLENLIDYAMQLDRNAEARRNTRDAIETIDSLPNRLTKLVDENDNTNNQMTETANNLAETIDPEIVALKDLADNALLNFLGTPTEVLIKSIYEAGYNIGHKVGFKTGGIITNAVDFKETFEDNYGEWLSENHNMFHGRTVVSGKKISRAKALTK